MIGKVRIQNFKSLRDVSVDLGRFTVFVGPNGSGKSSVLQALNGVCRVIQQAQHGAPADNEIYQSLSRGAQGPVDVTVQIKNKCFRYTSQFAPPAGGPPTNATLSEAPEFYSA